MFSKILLVAFAVMFVVIQLLILNYLVQLENLGCACAMDWRRGYIMFYLILSILNIFISSFVDESHIPYLQAVMVVIGILNIVFTIQYVNKLKKEKCDCSQSIYREIMMVVSVFNAIVYSSILLFAVYVLFAVANVVKGVNKKVKNTATASKKAALSKPVRKIKKFIKGT